MMQAIVNSATPGCRKRPVKSPLRIAWVFFRKPSVLSELLRSAEATTMFCTCSAK